ncbi:transposable element Tcb2 transposase [Trichonephila clavipes]|nr:transposable element Tcb2 transposase [Trichonephila clavipes]
MQRDCALRIAGKRRLTSFSVEYKTEPTASLAAIQAHVAPILGTPESSRTIRRRLDEGYLGSWGPLRVCSLTPTHPRLHLDWCYSRGNWTAVEWNQVIISDESRFNISSDDNRVRVYRPRGERLNPVCFKATHCSRNWCDGMGAIAYNVQSPPVLIRGTMTAQRHVHDILQPHVLPLMQ